MKRVFLSVSTILGMLVSVTPALAAPSADNRGNGHTEFERVVFVHYADNFAQKGGGGNNAPQLFSYSGFHWASINVDYWMNLANGGVSPADAVNGITASFQTWQNDAYSQIVFTYRGTTTAAPGLGAASPDYQNVVGWAYLSDRYPNAIAVNVVWATRGNKHIVDSDTALNTDSHFAWTQASITTSPDATPLPSTFSFDVDVQNIMTHEAGHWLQLNDLYSSSAAEHTMYGYASDRELKKRSLESGDLAGVEKIYL